MDRYLCIHGHFYQPPRENAWLEYIEVQDSSYPYHDWNARITAECYGPNSTSRILDSDGLITRIVDNYTRISFNFGPTLLAWMKGCATQDYESILEADRKSMENFAGHGSAIAQAYNHMIMPLASNRDKRTQVIWGVKDFEHRFKRKPEGMWLPETAVDLETLGLMAEMGIRFTILAPYQAARFREKGNEEWTSADGNLDTMQCYLANLGNGAKINIFFYDGEIANSLAFGDLLENGENFANRLISPFSQDETVQLVNVATDGETYGHHHPHGDMALAFALDFVEKNELGVITNYAQFLEKYPPSREVEILENTSWSCVHGVERWRSDSGCNTGAHPGWNQAWRAPLRESMDFLRDRLSPIFEHEAAALVNDPWASRNEYIRVILDRSDESIEAYLSSVQSHQLDENEKIRLLKLLELQRHAMLMYTSCGWFFDDLSGIETVQVIQYAGRAIQLAREITGQEIEEEFLTHLEKATSNIADQGNGRDIYNRYVRPAMIDLVKVGAHFALSSLFNSYNGQVDIYCYRIIIEVMETNSAGKASLNTGRIKIVSKITRESGEFAFGSLRFGDHNTYAGVCYLDEKQYSSMVQEISGAYEAADFPEAIRLLDKHFCASTFSLKDLFRDDQRKAIEGLLEPVKSDMRSACRQVYQQDYSVMRFISELGSTVPKGFLHAAEVHLDGELFRACSAEELDQEQIDRLQNIISEASYWDVQLDYKGSGYKLQKNMENTIQKLADEPGNIVYVDRLINIASVLPELPVEVNLRNVQNTYYTLLKTAYPDVKNKAGSEEWAGRFENLGRKLFIKVD